MSDATRILKLIQQGDPSAADQLSHNTHLTSSLQGLFPAGTDLQKEAAGFLLRIVATLPPRQQEVILEPELLGVDLRLQHGTMGSGR